MCTPIVGGQFYCICSSGFSGVYCQNSNACNNNPCLNGGTCQVIGIGNNYLCLCSSFYTGTNCQTCNKLYIVGKKKF